MKCFIITIREPGHPAREKSLAAAERCAASLRQHSIRDHQFFDAYVPEHPHVQQHLRDVEFMRGFRADEKYSMIDRCVACHLSHRELWNRCVADDEPFLILEHDALMIRDMPHDLAFDRVINLGAPSYGKFKQPKRDGAQPLFSKKYFPGTHAYAITPQGASEVLRRARKTAGPADVFFHLQRFPFLQEYHPWIFRADDRFSSVQMKHGGAIAKHGFHEDYEVV